MRGAPLDHCAKGHPPSWNYRDKGCPLCLMATRVRQQEQTIEQQQRRIAELEVQLASARLTRGPIGMA